MYNTFGDEASAPTEGLTYRVFSVTNSENDAAALITKTGAGALAILENYADEMTPGSTLKIEAILMSAEQIESLEESGDW